MAEERQRQQSVIVHGHAGPAKNVFLGRGPFRRLGGRRGRRKRQEQSHEKRAAWHVRSPAEGMEGIGSAHIPRAATGFAYAGFRRDRGTQLIFRNGLAGAAVYNHISTARPLTPPPPPELHGPARPPRLPDRCWNGYPEDRTLLNGDLQLSLGGSGHAVAPGGQLTYAITVTNAGSGEAASTWA